MALVVEKREPREKMGMKNDGDNVGDKKRIRRSRLRAIQGAVALFAPLLPKGNRKGGECGKGAGCHERLEIYKPQGPGRCVSPAGQ